MDDLRARLAEWEGEWQPIETAPKDGRLLLLFNPEGRHGCGDTMACCRWRDDHWTGFEEWYGVGGNPTHWRPLPPYPLR